MQVRNWIGTLNGIDASFDAEGYLRTMVERGLAKYAVGQLERGSETGRLHLQYFVQMERSRRLAHMRTVICDRSHWEPMYGSVAQAGLMRLRRTPESKDPGSSALCRQLAATRPRGGRGLCEGGDGPLQGGRGVLPGLGSPWPRPDVPAPAAEARRGSPLFGPEGPEVWVLWGPSGTGKSRFVAACWPDAFWKAPESKWWDGYSGQETVVLDDFKDYAMLPGRAPAPP